MTVPALTGPALTEPAVTVIGCDGGALPPGAAAALAGAALVVGARRHLDAVCLDGLAPGSARVAELIRLEEALSEIGSAGGPAVVLASGDPGFFGIVRALRARGIRPAVLPAVSSVALAFARLGLDWDDAIVLSAHGRDPGPVTAAALAHPKAAILTAPGEPASELAAALLAGGRRVYAAERLGTPGEKVAEVTGPGAVLADPNVLVALDPAAGGARPGGTAEAAGPGWVAGHRGAPAGWALPEEAFEHRDAMITKAEVRALVLARLGPGLGRTVWDIGAGSGSVAVECARFGASVYAVEADPAQCERIRRNAAAHGVGGSVRVVAGAAPAALAGLPAPDALFAGGGSAEVLAAALEAGRPGRAVAALASVDRVRAVTELLAAHGYRAEGVQLQAARLAPLPGGSLRLAGANPVFVISGERRPA
ncbi:MAG TPA: precorrin-6y C5,15-methyltransferase (decarboxylating) subunit CbiE [Streptosporangiaceae bacterium]|nr:precorrin-6y C5,15-methyltransferase (decarboxylating) subunit CbiE [Streptosporangiaceae bacterium]